MIIKQQPLVYQNGVLQLMNSIFEIQRFKRITGEPF